ncbi:restriction endonuclease subunit S [Vibrio vulnificus]|uniref:restriction endonuclease subunit S n=1 Tax=Vibrio vulnificus TaxID=672 RepID=UPI00069626BB|nr:restriction endonuclease subunit S [Vibrio vulnificus]
MSWPIVTLGEVAVFINGDRGKNYPSKGSFVESGVAFINAGSLSLEHRVVDSELNFITQEKYDSLRSGKIERGDILFCLRGSLGKFAVIENDLKGAIASSLVIIRANDKITLSYLKHYLGSVLCAKEIDTFENGAAQPNLSATDLKSFKIPLPPLDEQKRIAAILDQADAIRQKRKQAIALADEFLRSVFLDMFGDPVTNPKGWEVKEVSTVCTEIVDCVNRTAPTVDYETPYKMIRTTNVRDKKINLSETRYVEFETYKTWIRRLKPQKGDLIFTREAPAGEAGVIETDDFIFLGQRTMHFRPNQTLIHPVFLLHELTAAGVKRQIVKLSAGSTVTHLSVPECKKFLIRVPSIAKQLSFVNLVRELDKKVKRGTESLLDSDSLFNALSQKAFSGQL